MARLFGKPTVDDPPPSDTAPAPAAAPRSPLEGRLGEVLVREALISPEDLEAALADQESSGLRLGDVLVRSGRLDEGALSAALASHLGLGRVDMRRRTPRPEVSSRLNPALARELLAIPLEEIDGVVEVAVGDPRPDTEQRLRAALDGPVRMLLAPAGMVQQAIDRNYRALEGIDRYVSAYASTEQPASTKAAVQAEAVDSDSPIAQVVTKIVTQALRDRASDIHLEPSDERLRVRFRIDGALQEVLELPMGMAPALVSRIKILAGMNIVERRRAQDGQFTSEIDGRSIDVRVSTMATVWGEKCVMRVLDKRRSLYKLEDLGMPPDTYRQFAKMAHSPFGMVICAGPTGSGKTTTLYATLGDIDGRHRNIVTIEDPVEYVFPMINQIQTNEQAGVGFADGLRAILRQDPDVILVGEVRDIDTARTAVQAALTGHFVLSSLHATDSVAALHRFLDMGIEAFLVASSILGIVSQRLVRRICRGCAEPYEPTGEEMAFYTDAGGAPKEQFLQGVGCNLCANTGYQDRIGVYEFLTVTPEIRRLLVGWATQDELRRMAVSQGMRTLKEEGISLVAQDVTTISEIIRSIYSL